MNGIIIQFIIETDFTNKNMKRQDVTGNTMLGKYTKIQENTEQYKFLSYIVIRLLTQSRNSC